MFPVGHGMAWGTQMLGMCCGTALYNVSQVPKAGLDSIFQSRHNILACCAVCMFFVWAWQRKLVFQRSVSDSNRKSGVRLLSVQAETERWNTNIHINDQIQRWQTCSACSSCVFDLKSATLSISKENQFHCPRGNPDSNVLFGGEETMHWTQSLVTRTVQKRPMNSCKTYQLT